MQWCAGAGRGVRSVAMSRAERCGALLAAHDVSRETKLQADISRQRSGSLGNKGGNYGKE